MNELKAWEFEDNKFYTVEIGGEPWFIGNQIASILGYANGSRDVNRHVDDDDKMLIDRLQLANSENNTLPNQYHSNNATSGINSKIIIINESGLYSLILSSKLPNAKKFKKWVTSEVLPAIRKHGMYAMDDLIANPDLAINALNALKAEREKAKVLEDTVAVQTQQLAELQPKAGYYDVVLNTPDLLSTSEIAKDYGKSATWLNKTLKTFNIQYKVNGTWLLKQKYAEQGYTKSKTVTYPGKDGSMHSTLQTRWTQKGRLFIYDFLKSKGVLPLIEQDK